MKALSLRQPWLWAILEGAPSEGVVTPKRIENRRWNTAYRGEILLHAAKGCTEREHDEALDWMLAANLISNPATVPAWRETKRGGVYGKAKIVGVIPPGDVRAGDLAMLADVDPRWWMGEQYGFLLANVEQLPFVPWKGELGLFNIDDALFAEALEKARKAQ